jgi:hypothetical protein
VATGGRGKAESKLPDAHGAGGGRAPRGSRKGGKDIPALSSGINKLATRHDAGIWPHLLIRSSSEVGPGASVGTYGEGYLLLGCPDP